MKALASIVIATAALLSAPCTQADENSIIDAGTAANSWLATSDGGNPTASWDQAGRHFRSKVSADTWAKAFNAVRGPLGAVKSRQMKSAVYTRSVPGAPAGEYVVIQYATQFANKADAVETVTPMREPDGSWKVTGYFVK